MSAAVLPNYPVRILEWVETLDGREFSTPECQVGVGGFTGNVRHALQSLQRAGKIVLVRHEQRRDKRSGWNVRYNVWRQA